MTHVIEFPIHIGDFLSGTMHMDTLEKGAYFMLIISHMQAGEDGLPNDDKKLANITGVSTKVWNRIKPTLAEKFDISETFWRHKKCVEELQKIHMRSSNARAKALKRHKPDDAVATHQQCRSSANHKPSTNKEKIYKKESSVSHETKPTFEDFWKEYPKKTGIGSARAEWSNQIFLKNADPEVMVRAAKNYYHKRLNEDDQFTKSPAKFLSEQIYLDEDLSAEPPKPFELGELEWWQEQIVEDIGKVRFKNNFKGCELVGNVLYVPTQGKANWIKTQYLTAYRDIFNEVEVAKGDQQCL